MYVWGKTWEEAKRHAECLHYLFEVAYHMNQLGASPMSKQLGDGDSLSVKRMREDNEENDEGEEEERKQNGTKRQRRREGTTDSLGLASYDVVLLDIEGTTTPITFVKDVLFPYAFEHAEEFLRENWGEEETQRVLASFGIFDEALPDSIPFSEDNVSAIVSHVHGLIEQDKKDPPLKELQGLIWRRGYEEGELKGQVFEDVPSAFQQWANQLGKRVSIFSSGSRSAQQLLFHYSTHGPLTRFLSSYFDPKLLGYSKRERGSYDEILLTLGYTHDPTKVLFVTDIIEEAEAARESGMQVVVSIREGNGSIPASRLSAFPSIQSFDAFF